MKTFINILLIIFFTLAVISVIGLFIYLTILAFEQYGIVLALLFGILTIGLICVLLTILKICLGE